MLLRPSPTEKHRPVNLSEIKSQGRIRVPFENIARGPLRMTDAITGGVYDSEAGELCDPGGYVELEPWEFHVLRF